VKSGFLSLLITKTYKTLSVLSVSLVLFTEGYSADIPGDSVKTADSLSTEKPAIELGGFVTVDFGNTIDELDRSSMEMGEVELSALVNIADELTATVVLGAQEDLSKPYIDQAFGSYTPENMNIELIFGQHYFNHGLLSTQLISDPSITDIVEFVHPGLTTTYTFGKFTSGLGFTILKTEEATNDGIEVSSSPTGIINLDYLFDEEGESILRLSALAGKSSADFDVAASLTFGKFIFSAEYYNMIENYSDISASGYYAGIGFSPVERFLFAVRYDGISDGLFDAVNQRIAAGIKVTVNYGIFCAAEFAHVKPFEEDGYQELAFQIGLEQKIKLPGFQRKTLTNNN
jgi:hypothetical protein